MSNPFAEHAQNDKDYQAMLKGDDGSGGAALTFATLPAPVTVDCTYEWIQDNWHQGSGQIPMLVVMGCRFHAADIPATCTTPIRKGLNCTLKPNPTAKPVPCRLDIGGLEQGGLIYRFNLCDVNYSA